MKFLAEEILPHAEGRTGTELKAWVRSELKRRFRYVSLPPRWLQSPAWPIQNGQPLVFMGQLNLPNYFHDTGSIYVFHNPDSNEFEVVTQIT